MFEINIMRRLRARLIRDGLLPANLRFDGAHDDNFVEPTRVQPGVDLHALALAEFMTALTEAQRAYTETVLDWFGLALPGTRAGVVSVELNWDVPCDVARHVPTGWWKPWSTGLVGAARRIGAFDDEDEPRVRTRAAVFRREPGAARGSTTLRADSTKGTGAKLYVKHNRLVRAEVTYQGRSARRILRHSIQTGTVEALESDLVCLARRFYEALLEAQQVLTDRPVLEFAAIHRAFHRAGSWRKVGHIVEALSAGEAFHNAAGRFSSPLVNLRKLGLVEYHGGGLWKATPELARAFALYRSRGEAA
ncbi:hypothetical protein [Anaeromyxobacter sp. SG17]|uniref:hypothetical protein n=1 Tax=Anaeromyxobacter sp. SG17 TaxID=2925405 RepID=UPI001F582EEC|nr:hypothetical protein [Anaeromyxobacter sp. SG17]